MFVQVQDIACEGSDQVGADFLGLHRGVLRVRSSYSSGGHGFCVVAALVAQPGCDAAFAGAADAGRGCVLREEYYCRLEHGVVEDGFQGGEVFEQDGAEYVDCPGPFADQISAPGNE